MRQRLKLIIATSLTLLTTGALAADIEHCLRAYTAGQEVQAFRSCLPLAQAGDPEAAFVLARLYALGVDGKAPEWGNVVEWLSISAGAGHAEAAYNLAIAYQKGKGAAADLQQSLKYYRQSAELGNPKAMRNLAMLYEKGEGVERDLPRAFALYQRSAESGLADSQLKSGLMLLQGEGVEQDLVAARHWIEKSAEAGNDKAQLALGVLLIDFDPENAIGWYTKAVAAGNPYAAHNLALLYLEGQHVPQDLFQALAYAGTSLEIGNQETQLLYDQILARIEEKQSRQERSVISVAVTPEPVNTGADEAGTHPVVTEIVNLDWLKAQPQEYFVVQLARLKALEGAHRFIKDFQLESLARIVSLDQDDYVILIKDSFAVKAAALNALQVRLPPLFMGEAWVRSYSSLYKH